LASAKIATQTQRAPVAMTFVRRSAASFSESSTPEGVGAYPAAEVMTSIPLGDLVWKIWAANVVYETAATVRTR
jgi:hypothetical protein